MTAPPARIAKSARIHSGRLSDTIATRSPFPMPDGRQSQPDVPHALDQLAATDVGDAAGLRAPDQIGPRKPSAHEERQLGERPGERRNGALGHQLVPVHFIDNVQQGVTLSEALEVLAEEIHHRRPVVAAGRRPSAA